MPRAGSSGSCRWSRTALPARRATGELRSVSCRRSPLDSCRHPLPAPRTTAVCAEQPHRLTIIERATVGRIGQRGVHDGPAGRDVHAANFRRHVGGTSPPSRTTGRPEPVTALLVPATGTRAPSHRPARNRLVQRARPAPVKAQKCRQHGFVVAYCPPPPAGLPRAALPETCCSGGTNTAMTASTSSSVIAVRTASPSCSGEVSTPDVDKSGQLQIPRCYTRRRPGRRARSSSRRRPP